MNHRKHLALHLAAAGVVIAVVALRAIGVDVPQWVAYATLAACPLMMITMMISMNHTADPATTSDEAGAAARPQPPERRPAHH